MNLLSSPRTETEQTQTRQPLKSLVCIRSQPYPALGGSPLRNLQNLEALKTLGTVSLFSLYKGPQKVDSYGGLAHWKHCDLNNPQRSPQEKLRNRLRWLRPTGQYYTDWIHSAHYAQQFEAFLEQVQPELILMAELWLFPYLPIALAYRDRHPSCKVIVDNHNVEGLLAQERYQGQETVAWKDKIDLALNAQAVRRMERLALEKVDQFWVCSETDAAAMASLYLSKNLGASASEKLREKIEVIPNCVEVDRYAAPAIEQPGSTQTMAAPPETQPPATSPKILFLGSFGYAPNEEAARILIEQVYPQLQQRNPATQLMLVGRGATAWMEDAAQANPNLVVTGAVERVEPYLHDADVMVVPLRQGSGTRLKLLEAFAAKLPVVSTYKAAEGLTVVDGQHLLLRDEVDDMVAAIAELLASSAWQQQLTESAYELVQSQYSWNTAAEKIRQVLGRSAETVHSAAQAMPAPSQIPTDRSEGQERAIAQASAPQALSDETVPTKEEPVAVVIPLHNKADFIARTLNSVLNQTYLPREIIVVDDGSQDGSGTVAEAWSLENQAQLTQAQIKFRLISQAQAGPGAARNRGAAESTASLLSFLDADDEWMPDFLAEATQALYQHQDCMLAAFGQYRGAEQSNLAKRFGLLGIRSGPWRLPLDLSPQVMKPTVDFVFSGATVIRRSGFEELGGFYSQVGCTYGEDTYFWLQAQLRYPIYRDPKAMMWYHTECSALGIWNRQAPVNPILSQPEALRRSCPGEYALFLERYLAQVAIMTARRFANYGDRDTARSLLERFPLSRTFKTDHTKANLDILLTNFPALRSWILKAKFSG